MKRGQFYKMIIESMYKNGNGVQQEKSARTSQESTKRDSSVEGSRNITEISNRL